MKIKRLFFIPAALVLLMIITSVVAFYNSQQLEDGYLYITDDSIETTFEGTYLAILGDLDEDDYSITVESHQHGIHMTIKNSSGVITKDYLFRISEPGAFHDESLVESYLYAQNIVLDELDDYVFTLDLKSATTYNVLLEQTTDNIDEEMIDIVLVNIPYNIFNTKTIMENVSYTTAIFAVLSLFTIMALWYVKRH